MGPVRTINPLGSETRRTEYAGATDGVAGPGVALAARGRLMICPGATKLIFHNCELTANRSLIENPCEVAMLASVSFGCTV